MLQNNIQAVYQKQNYLFNICINTCTYNRYTLRTISSYDGDIVILKVSNKKTVCLYIYVSKYQFKFKIYTNLDLSSKNVLFDTRLSEYF